jgi:hypothetical protein
MRGLRARAEGAHLAAYGFVKNGRKAGLLVTREGQQVAKRLGWKRPVRSSRSRESPGIERA